MAASRLQKILAAAGVASRRAAERLIRAGRVSVNGERAQIGDSADPELDLVTLDGEPLESEPLAYWVVHKPRGVLTTVRDPEGRRTVLSLLPSTELRLFPVGRLDFDTEGLVLMTNDGALTHALLHPSHEVEREYRVTVKGRVTPDIRRRLAEGVRLEDGLTAPARVGRVRFDERSDTSRFGLILIEGRRRQIRRALDVLGHRMVRLVRVRMGPISLGRLARGAARPLRPTERRALLQLRTAPGRARAKKGAALRGRSGAGKTRRKRPSRGGNRRSRPPACQHLFDSQGLFALG